MANYGNSLVKKAEQKKSQEVVYKANNQTIKLTPGMIKKYLVSGDAERVTDQEVVMFMQLCANACLDPWQREAYCIKYGNSPATMVVGKDAYQKRADADPNFDGQEAGVVVVDADGILQHRDGCLVLDGETLVGGWAKVWRKDRKHPSTAECSLMEYCGRKKDGQPNGQWSGKPATMIRKVALVQALREAFPARLGGLYVAEERGVEEPVEAKFTEVPNNESAAPAAIEEPQQRPQIAVQPEPQPEEVPAPVDDDFFAGVQ